METMLARLALLKQFAAVVEGMGGGVIQELVLVGDVADNDPRIKGAHCLHVKQVRVSQQRRLAIASVRRWTPLPS